MFAGKTDEEKTKDPKILMVIGLVILLLASLNRPVSAVPPQAQLALSPLNPAFVQYMNDRKSGELERTADGHSLGYLPSPHAPLPEVSAGDRTQPQTDWALPSSYDLRSLNKLTPVKDQGNYGTCWAFGAFGSLESSLLPGETWRFSEDNLVLNSGFDASPEGPYNHGGVYDMATAYLARWGGPVRQDEDAYGDSYTPPGLSPHKHIQEVLYLPNKSGPTNNDLIKNAVMTYGGVSASMKWSDGSFNDMYDSFYYSGSRQPNHAVVIVGWDDAFPASKFNKLPPGNGAFIVRNSWGTWFGQGGYFYISYYDSIFGYNNYITDVAVYNNAESTTNYDHIYQYDPLGWVTGLAVGMMGTLDSSTMAWFANAFTAGDGENLAAVSFYTPVMNASYEIYSGGALSSMQFRKSGTIEFPGYHTIPLDSMVTLPSGQGFVVAVKLTTPGSNYPVALEYPEPGYSSQATASAGQSFVSSNGTSWSDITDSYANTNVCLKAFTTEGGVPEPNPTLSLSPNSLDFGASDTQKIFTVQNSGGGMLSWNALESCDWITGVSPSSGSLGSGQGQNVTVLISRDAKAPGTYNSTVSITSNGGSQGVSVALTVPSLPPEAQTGATDGLSQSAATLHGAVHPHQLTTSAWFQWGLSSQYGQETAHGNVGSGNSWVPTSASLSGLLAGQTYHYRLVAQNASGLAYGVDCTFTTDSPPLPLAIGSISATPNSGVSSWNPVTIQASANRSGTWSGIICHPSGVQIGTLTGGSGSTYSAVWTPAATQNFYSSGFYAVVLVTVDSQTKTSTVTFSVENYPAKILQVSLVNEAFQSITNPHASQVFYVRIDISNNSTGAFSSAFSPVMVGDRYIGANGLGNLQPGQQASFYVRCGGLAVGSYPSRAYVWVSLGGYSLAQPIDFSLTVLP